MTINVTGAVWRGKVINGNDRDNFFDPTDDGWAYYGFGGNDTFDAGNGGDYIDGGTGIDTVTYVRSNAAVQINLFATSQRGGHAEGDVLVSIENLVGSDFGDDIVGNDGNNRLEGGRGADLLDGGLGNDTLIGGLDGSADTLYGRGGIDTVDYSDATLGMTIRLDSNFEAGTAFTNAHRAEINFGGRVTTMLVPEIQEDYLFGIENVKAGAGNDTIIGNSQNNVITGGAGIDHMEGGGGADRFIFDDGDFVAPVIEQQDNGFTSIIFNADSIGNFERGVDRIDFSRMDANTRLAGDQSFRVVEDFTGLGGELSLIRAFRPSTTDRVIEVWAGDTNGDQQADFFLSIGRPVDQPIDAGAFIL